MKFLYFVFIASLAMVCVLTQNIGPETMSTDTVPKWLSGTDLNSDKKNQVIKAITNAQSGGLTDLQAIVEYVKRSMDYEYGQYWAVFSFRNGSSLRSFFNYNLGNYGYLEFKELRWMVFKPSPKFWLW